MVISLTKVASRDRSGAGRWHRLGCGSLRRRQHISWAPSPPTKIGRELPTPLTRPVLRARCCCSHAPGAHRGRTGVSLLQPLVAVGRCWLRADASGECLNLGSGNSALASAARVAILDIFSREAPPVSQTQRPRTEPKRGDPESSAPPLYSHFALLLTFSSWKYLSFDKPGRTAENGIFFSPPHSSFFPTFGLFFPARRL